MLESDAYDRKEINIVREKLSTAEVNKMLIELSDMYESNNKMEGKKRTTDEWRSLMKNILPPTTCSRMSRCFKRRKWVSHYSRSSRKSGQPVKSIRSQ